ncbi:hypothetical protein JMJ77_0013722 [Colletotrichum scovillei]|uniref:Uncharacterized protein n=1 Tax=Colletotrichum scovillei TaxID=1209932 RepID=A0A9P7U5M0_9PEZI|nr:hypothetical protein JMJ77_0015431 [Colletotrichum scovillei]KAG7048072.1 hypothetical protein JMJ77_0013722 [Colletotrichum scovillei]KAG7060383.1 hypothetical protein JMJ76_0003559 [Colletotrichum scovillei]KAG7065237.1 hypothetical protein JMJ78_0011996 [Colletotrichum scovillei]KAG7067838.1 hypothetical protein JMJ76_0007540 [Colletotrichum scovillei]
MEQPQPMYPLLTASETADFTSNRPDPATTPSSRSLVGSTDSQIAILAAALSAVSTVQPRQYSTTRHVPVFRRRKQRQMPRALMERAAVTMISAKKATSSSADQPLVRAKFALSDNVLRNILKGTTSQPPNSSTSTANSRRGMFGSSFT